jgi:hypothetical protein
MEDKITSKLHQSQESQGYIEVSQPEDDVHYKNMTTAGIPAQGPTAKSYNMKLAFPRDQNKPEQMTILIMRIFAKDPLVMI